MKKRILFIIALIMIISTIIRTVIVGASFISFSSQIIENQTLLLTDIIKEVQDKNKFLKLIQKSQPIKHIEIIPGVKYDIFYDLKHKTIISFAPYTQNSSIKIVYLGKQYFAKFLDAIIQLIAIALISLILIIVIVNYFLTPYLEILEKIKTSTEEILHGNFKYKLDTKLKGEAKDFVDSYNDFINKLNDSFGVIEKKYTALIEKQPGNNPLVDAKETIEQLANIFKFKRVIEDDLNERIILNRIIEVVKSFDINHYVLVGIDNNEKKVFYIENEGDICCSVKENPIECRAYRLKHNIDSQDYKNLCAFHMCDNEYYCIPFSVEGNFTGILKIMYEKNDENIIKNIPYIKAYLKETSSIIESKYTLELLKKQSIKDPLTSLYNRRYMEEILPQIMASAKRKNTKVGFLMIDIDYFKKVNDTYGHDAGDKILQTVSNVILNNIRESDIAVRFGGEEFLIILTDLNSKEDLKKAAEKIRETIQNTKFNTGREIIKKTVSIGASIFPDVCQKPWECIKFADLALYKAKNNGRNQVVVFDEKIKKEANY